MSQIETESQSALVADELPLAGVTVLSERQRFLKNNIPLREIQKRSVYWNYFL